MILNGRDKVGGMSNNRALKNINPNPTEGQRRIAAIEAREGGRREGEGGEREEGIESRKIEELRKWEQLGTEWSGYWFWCGSRVRMGGANG